VTVLEIRLKLLCVMDLCPRDWVAGAMTTGDYRERV
jgi:hypothetical protein